MAGIYEKAINSIKNQTSDYKFFQSLLYGTCKQEPKIANLQHYNFYNKKLSQCAIYLHQQHIGVLVCVDKWMPGLRAYFNIKNIEISEFSYAYQLNENIKQNQYVVLKEKQDILVLVFQDQVNRNYFRDHLKKLKEVLSQVSDSYDPLILKAFIKADTNQNGEISWNQLKDLVRLMKVELNKSTKDYVKKVIGKEKIETVQFSQFERLWKIFYCRNELIGVFQKYNREQFHTLQEYLAPKLDIKEFQRFLMQEQKQSEEDSNSIIQKLYESSSYSLSFYDFCHYIFGPSNNLLNYDYKNKKTDGHKPLNHYYCYSSHNTYLTGDQLFSDSRVERYLVDLENGLRCVEIDVHDGSQGPIVKHGYTPTSSILFRDVIQSIKRFADLNPKHTPIILSLQVHCNNQNQQKMADCLTQFLNNQILLISQGNKFPTLDQCIGKIIIKGPGDFQLFEKNKKQRSAILDGEFAQEEQEEYQIQEWQHQNNPKQALKLSSGFSKTKWQFINHITNLQKQKKQYFGKKKQFKKVKIQPTKLQQEIENKSRNSLKPDPSKKKMEKQNNNKKYKVSGKLLSLICMLSKAKVQSTCCWESNSFSENKLKDFCNDPKKFDQILELATQKWFRSYPDGLRILSSNYNPIPALQLGIQIVAINTQSKNDVNSHILKAFFTKGQSKTMGFREKVYLERRSNNKGHILTRAENNLHGSEKLLNTENYIENLAQKHNKSQVQKKKMIKAQIKFISGLRIYQNDQNNRKIPPVEIRAYFTGTQRDNKRNERLLNPKEYTEIVYNEAFNPKFNKIETLQLKCVDPELGFLVVEILQCGRSVIPIDCLKQGLRVISLYDDELKEKESKILCQIELTKSTIDVDADE